MSIFVKIPETMKLLKPILILFVLSIIGSCATPYAPFREPMLTEFKLDSKNIKNVQFYLSDEILLFKVQDQQAAGKQDGTFMKTEGGVSEKVRIKASTPCIVEHIDKDGFFYVRFEEGKDKLLKFKKTDNNRYNLHTDTVNNRHQIEYGGEVYFVTTTSLASFLMVKVKKTKNEAVEKRLEGKRA
jgi:hypothetical protein